MIDERIKVLAKGLVNYSCRLQKGEKILIEAKDIDYPLVNAILEEVYKVGGVPFVNLSNSRITRAIMQGLTKEHAEAMAKYDGARMADMQAYIGIRGGNNCYELSDISGETMQVYSKYYSHPVHHALRVKNTKWVILRYPNEGMAELAKMSTDAFEDFYFNVCNLDYAKMDKAMNNMAELIAKTDKVRIVSVGTDISFSIKDIGSKNCAGECNIPDGEIYTAPVKTSVNGVISYNTPSINRGIEFKGVRLVFKDGKIIEATCENDNKALNEIFDTDEGARYVGEFAFGVNPYINNAMGDILFDEKIAGSIHFTPGSCYDDCDNGNQSAEHWDLVLIQTPEFGGGEIYFDDVLIRKDGRFILPELYCLNAENLK